MEKYRLCYQLKIVNGRYRLCYQLKISNGVQFLAWHHMEGNPGNHPHFPFNRLNGVYAPTQVIQGKQSVRLTHNVLLLYFCLGLGQFN